MILYSIREYAQAIRNRYRKATKGEKTKILDEFTQATGLHCKAAIRWIYSAGLIDLTTRG